MLPIIFASLVSGIVAFLPVVILILFLSRAIYHVSLPPQTLSLLLFLCIGVLSFRSLGMIVARAVNSMQEAQIVIQILYVPMLFLSGATFPVSMMPNWIQIIAQFLPATYLFQGMRPFLSPAGPSSGQDSFAWSSDLLRPLHTKPAQCVQGRVTLIAGSDAGNMLVVHGPTVQE